MAEIDEQDPIYALGLDQRQQMKNIQDELMDIILVLDTISDTVHALRQSYMEYCSLTDPNGVVNETSDMVYRALLQKFNELALHKKAVEALHEKIQGTIGLVRPCRYAPRGTIRRLT